MSIKTLLGQATSVLSVGKSNKTEDPRYVEAERLFDLLSVDVGQIIGTLMQLLSQVQGLTRASMKLGQDVQSFVADSDKDMRLRVGTFSGIVQKLDAMTQGFLSPRVDQRILKGLADYQLELDRLASVKEQRTKLAPVFNEKSTKLHQALDKQLPAQKLREIEAEMKVAKEKYDAVNEDFIASVNRLAEIRKDKVSDPSRLIVALISQYLLEFFTDLQKLRAVYPPEMFEDVVKTYAPAGEKQDADFISP